MNIELIKRLQSDVDWHSKSTLTISETREVLSMIKEKQDVSRIAELEAEVAQLQADLDEAWKMLLPL